NDLVPLAPVKRLVFFDCIYRTDKPAIPSGAPDATLAPKDRPEFTTAPPRLRVLDEGHEPFQPRPFNTRRAIEKLTSASSGCVVAGYSATPGGSPRYGLYERVVNSAGKEEDRLRTPGTRPVVDIPVLVELRDTRRAYQAWSPSNAFDMLALSRYLELG